LLRGVVASAVVLGACASPTPPPRPTAPPVAAPLAPIPPIAVEPVVVPPSPEALAARVVARARGWGWLVDKLVVDGLPLDRVVKAFADRRVPAFDGLFFSPDPRESRAMYRHFLRTASVARARRCAALHAPALDAAQRIHGVDAAVVAAILHVETACGANTGRSLVLHRLARLAMANEPRNVARNLSRRAGRDGVIEPELGERVRARARYLEGVFYPQVIATFEVARVVGVEPLDLRGSSAGAFGYPQFLPLNYLAFATDGDGDGRASLYEPADAIASCARFLASHGWRPGLPLAEKRRIVRRYNPSDPYIDAVLGLAQRIDASGVIEMAAAETVGASLPPGP
jgi:membrane-bound lytic murein transglycosylase B